MDIIITYDLTEKAGADSKHTAVKNGMKTLGYMDNFTLPNDQTGTACYLPNTTLWKKNITSEQAKNDLLNVAKQNNADVERLIATQLVNFAAIPGKAYSKQLIVRL